MGNVGPWEMMVIAVVALLVFGPNRLPELGRSLGRALREFRRASRELREEVRRVVDEEEPPAPPGGRGGGGGAPAPVSGPARTPSADGAADAGTAPRALEMREDAVEAPGKEERY